MSAKSQNNLTINKKVSADKVIKKMRENWIKIAKEKERKTINYLDKHILHLLHLDEFVGMRYSLKKKFELDYHYYKGVADYISREAVEKGLVPIFVTLTLPSKYHRFRINKRTGKHVFNPRYKGYTIKEGYKLLQKASREILRHFKSYGKYRKGYNIPYIKAVEAHKDGTAHEHFVAWLPEWLVDDFIRIVKSKIKLFSLGRKYKIEVLKDVDKGSGYLLKYLRKTLLDNNEENLYVLDGWRKENRIRIFTHSQAYLKRRDFEKILPHFTDELEEELKDYL
ncbi:replication endonuclease [Caminibacter pacificus]|nr:replication endonuclease [Caminibacter pacificus]ROR40940.1 bacteriophage replication gene A protein [Caminibacter pacificus]